VICHYPPLGFRVVSSIYFHAFPPLSANMVYVRASFKGYLPLFTAGHGKIDKRGEFEAAKSKARPSLVEVVRKTLIAR
jgi:hypothetical protein